MLPWLGKTAKVMELAMYARFKASGIDLTVKQWLLLKFLMIKDGQSQKQLSVITDRDKGSLTRLISTMEKKKLVKRVKSEVDSRKNLIYATALGRERYQKALPVLESLVKDLQKDITEQEIVTLIDILKKVLKNLET